MSQSPQIRGLAPGYDKEGLWTSGPPRSPECARAKPLAERREGLSVGLPLFQGLVLPVASKEFCCLCREQRRPLETGSLWA